jgi:formyltetrahydrofolate-dependent phosphoribosylglycinamide formyltransferase
MFERLQKKWKVSGTQLALVLCVFALGGSATGWMGKVIMNWLSVERGWLWTLIYIIVVTLLWPLTVLIVSIPFGQFSFFTNYLKRIGSRIGIVNQSGVGSQESGVSARHRDVVGIAIFASGAGSNAQKIIEYFGTVGKGVATIKLIVCNNPQARVLKLAEENGVPTLLLEKEKFFRGTAYVDELKRAEIDFIVLAGFLWKVPQRLIDEYRNNIVNIHPALLPKYGGKGMYGLRVHEAVINSGEKESGITIHRVDEHYDNGDIVFQEKVTIAPGETPESLAAKIHVLEHRHYPRIIEELILQANSPKKPNGR